MRVDRAEGATGSTPPGPARAFGHEHAFLRFELAAIGYRETAFHLLAGDVGDLAIVEAPAADQRPEPAAITPCWDEATRTC